MLVFFSEWKGIGKARFTIRHRVLIFHDLVIFNRVPLQEPGDIVPCRTVHVSLKIH